MFFDICLSLSLSRFLSLSLILTLSLSLFLKLSYLSTSNNLSLPMNLIHLSIFYTNVIFFRKGVGSRYFILLSDCLLYTSYQGAWAGDNTSLKVRESE